MYLFNDYDEYKDYFIVNGFENITDDILKLCKMKLTSKGTVIALKHLCDSTIKKYKEKNNSAIENRSTKISKKLSAYKRMENNLASQMNSNLMVRERHFIKNRRYM